MALRAPIVALLWLSIVASGVAGISVSRTLGNGMILQRAPASARVYGFGTPGDAGHVAFGSSTIPFVVDGSGAWLVKLPPTPAGGPHTIAVVSFTEGTVILSNVLFGDVWFCGGQSNMGMSVSYALNASAEIPTMTAQNYPTVRLFHVGGGYFSYAPFADLQPAQSLYGGWAEVNPTIGAGFSAVCWYFGRTLYETYKGTVPIGLIQNQYGGTPIQAWSSPDALARCPNMTSPQPEEGSSPVVVNVTALPGEPPAGPPTDPSVLWNAMAYPFVRMELAGWTWYQGESNTGGGSPFHGPRYYSCAFPSMIEDWRAKFQNPDAPFLFVQLSAWCIGPTFCNETAPTYSYDRSVADMRVSQMSAIALPRVGWVVSDDLGDMDAPAGSVHPRNKVPVGRRLAAAALNVTLGNVAAGGPLFQSAVLRNGSVAVQLRPSLPGLSISLQKVSCPPGIQVAFCNGAGFELSGDAYGMKWALPTSVAVTGANTLSVSTPEVPAPKWIRYKYYDWPLSTVVDSEGFPLTVFLEAVTQN